MTIPMYKPTRKEMPLYVPFFLTFLLFLSLVTSFWIFSSYMEAKTYTKITRVKVSTWDAMWVKLVVVTGPGTNEEPK